MEYFASRETFYLSPEARGGHNNEAQVLTSLLFLKQHKTTPLSSPLTAAELFNTLITDTQKQWLRVSNFQSAISPYMQQMNLFSYTSNLLLTSLHDFIFLVKGGLGGF